MPLLDKHKQNLKLNKQEFEDIKKLESSSSEYRKNIVSLLETQIERVPVSLDSFEDPNWALKQAYLAGQKAGIELAIKIIKE